MTGVCVVAIIAMLLAFMFWLVSKEKPSTVKEPEDDCLVKTPELTHCFHPEDGTPDKQRCCYCGEPRLSQRPLNGHGSKYQQETDIVDEQCYRRCYEYTYVP